MPVILFMLGGGAALALFVIVTMARERRRDPRAGTDVAGSIRESVEASLLFHVMTAGGMSQEEAIHAVRTEMGKTAAVTRGIDLASWAENFARHATDRERTTFLDRAVRMVASAGKPVPLRQYAALLDLSFGLGFQTDALARLREAYGFDYIDHAREARLRNSRGGVQATPHKVDELLAALGLSGAPSRQELGLAYRRLVAKHHPDRFHAAPVEERDAAAARFIEITRAYENLLRTIRD